MRSGLADRWACDLIQLSQLIGVELIGMILSRLEMCWVNWRQQLADKTYVLTF